MKSTIKSTFLTTAIVIGFLSFTSCSEEHFVVTEIDPFENQVVDPNEEYTDIYKLEASPQDGEEVTKLAEIESLTK